MNATFNQPRPIIPDTIPCKGSKDVNVEDWPDDEVRSRVATHLLANRDSDLLWLERDACLKQVEGFEMDKDDVHRMDRLVNQYGWEMQ